MDIQAFLCPRGEKPLDVIPADGGFASIFRSISCIGDSLSSGEFELKNPQAPGSTYHDLYDYSWGQFMARMLGSRVNNFSRGGMTAKEYCESFAEQNDMWNPEKATQCYIIALGVNDVSMILREELTLGTAEDISTDENAQAVNFIGYYAKIIARYQKISPYAKFFLMTMPRGDNDEQRSAYYDKHRELMYELEKVFDNTFVIDLREYACVYDDDFCKNFFLYGHMTPTGYVLTAKIVAAYMDFIIRHNPERFKDVGFILTDLQDRIPTIES